jgi:hypothetical protein
MVDLTTNLDWSLAAWNVELAAMPRADGMLPMAVAGDLASRDQTIIPDWALHWVHALWNLWRYTGATPRVARLLPVAERVLRWFEPFADGDGLLTDVTGWVIVDWAAVSTAGKSAALNALWARGLRDYADVANDLGCSGAASWAAERVGAIRAGFELFWDEARSLYVDHAVGGRPERPVSQHANAAAVAAGLVPTERHARVLDAILDPAKIVHAAWLVPGREAVLEGAGDMYGGASYLVLGKPEPWWDVERRIVAAQPFFRYIVHDAVAAAGRSDPHPLSVATGGNSSNELRRTWSEVWYGGSYCHGWCSTPTRPDPVHARRHARLAWVRERRDRPRARRSRVGEGGGPDARRPRPRVGRSRSHRDRDAAPRGGLARARRSGDPARSRRAPARPGVAAVASAPRGRGVARVRPDRDGVALPPRALPTGGQLSGETRGFVKKRVADPATTKSTKPKLA